MGMTLATSIARNPAVNLFLAETGLDSEGKPTGYRLVMPDKEGSFPPEVLRKRTGLSLVWPCDPHATGERMILTMLNRDYAHGIKAPVTHPDFTPF